MAKIKSRPLSERKWIRSVLDKYEEAEKLRPKHPGLDADWPEWVNNLFRILMGVSHPGLKFKRGTKWTAKDLGLFLGRQSALEALTWGEVPLSSQVQEETTECIAAIEKLSPLNSSPAQKRALQKFERDMAKWRPVFKSFIDESLASARARSYPESTAFLTAFGKGVKIKPNDFAAERTIGVGERIAWVMVVHWRTFANLESVAQLHHILATAAKSHGLTITLKRIEKLCTRIGLKFKGRGRPKKRIQTNPA